MPSHPVRLIRKLTLALDTPRQLVPAPHVESQIYYHAGHDLSVTNAAHDTSIAALGAQIVQALNAGALDAALRDLQTLQDTGSEPVLTLHLTGLAFLRANEIGKAVGAFEAAHRLRPEINEPVEVLAILYAKLGRIADGLYYGKLSIAAQDRFPVPGLIPDWLGTFEQSFFNMQESPLLAQGDLAMAAGDYAAAIHNYRQATEVDARAVDPWRRLATAYRLAGQPFEALTISRHIERLTAPTAADYTALAQVLEQLGHWHDALECHDHAATLAPDDEQITWGPLRCRLNQPAEATDIAAATQRWRDANPCTPVFDPPVPAPALPAPRPLRLGVYTANWLHGEALSLIVPLLTALPPTTVSVHVYSDGPADTPMARRLRGHAKGWESLSDLDDETAAFTLGNEELDAIIDLDGPLRRRRPRLFLYRPHPLCLSLLDLPETARAAGYAAALTDEPSGLERPGLIGIPGIASSLPADLSLLTERAPRREESGEIVFGTLAPYGRISDTAAVLWGDLLTRVPGSVLALEPDRIGGDAGTAELSTRFTRLGLRDRIRIEPREQAATEYLARVDLLLDPPGCPHYEEPVAALAAGVPVITAAGTTPPTQVLANWLTMLGLSELTATNGADYVNAATAAVAPGARTTLRDRLDAAIDRERIGGAASRARLMEAALREMIARASQIG
jgi:predicted O-linked N-acetylglucosamine transferase (SPINDLY family)